MSEQTSPLFSDQGRTTVADAVVSKIAGVAAEDSKSPRQCAAKS